MLSTYKLLLPLPSQMIAFVKLWRYPCPTDSPNFFTASGRMRGNLTRWGGMFIIYENIFILFLTYYEHSTF